MSGAVQQLVAQDVTTRPLVDNLTVIERQFARLQPESARRMTAMRRTAAYQAYGYRSVAGLLESRVRAHAPEVRSRMLVAGEVEHLAEVAAAWQSGQITSRHVEVIAQARHAADTDEHFDEFAPSLLRVAKSGTPADVAAVVKRWRDALDNDLDRDGSQTRAGALAERRGVHLHKLLDGLYHLDATLEGDGAKVVARALRCAYKRAHRADDSRSPAQQRADALVAICATYLGGLTRTGNLPHVLVITDAETLAGEAVGWACTDDGERLDPDTIRRIACHAFRQDVLVDRDGVVLDMGRATRTFTPDQYRALVIRDGGCRGPTCNAPPDQCNPHHLDEWVADDGPTDMSNGALFCEHGWHRDLHEGRMRVEGDPNDELRFYDRDDQRIATSHPRTPPTRIPTRLGRQLADDRARMEARIAKLMEQHRPDAA